VVVVVVGGGGGRVVVVVVVVVLGGEGDVVLVVLGGAGAVVVVVLTGGRVVVVEPESWPDVFAGSVTAPGAAEAVPAAPCVAVVPLGWPAFAPVVPAGPL
jgi:hypothetical protein